MKYYGHLPQEMSVTDMLTKRMICKNMTILLQLDQHAACNYEGIVFQDYHLRLLDCEAV